MMVGWAVFLGRLCSVLGSSHRCRGRGLRLPFQWEPALNLVLCVDPGCEE